MKRLGIILFLLLGQPSHAAEWIKVHTQADGDQYFYDRSKLVISGEEISYWKKVVFKTPVALKGQTASSGLYREHIHCTEHTLKLISYLLYAPDGNAIEYSASHEGDASPIIPDSVGDVFEKTVCELVRQKQESARLKAMEEEAGKRIRENTPPAQSASEPQIPLPAQEPPPTTSPSPQVVN